MSLFSPLPPQISICDDGQVVERTLVQQPDAHVNTFHGLCDFIELYKTLHLYNATGEPRQDNFVVVMAPRVPQPMGSLYSVCEMCSLQLHLRRGQVDSAGHIHAGRRRPLLDCA